MSTPYQTSKAEWDKMAEEFYAYFLSYLRSKATQIDQIETYNPSDYEEFARRVKSLPARYDYDGVRKTVLVPLEILSRDAKAAAEEARQATEESRQATKEANSARDNANRAAEEADRAREDLDEIKSKTVEATKAANQAANRAELAAVEADQKMAEFTTQEQQRQAAELARENAFTDALAKFEQESGKAISDVNVFLAFAKKAWEEFVAIYENKQIEIETAEAERKTAEKARAEAEETRQKAEDDRENKVSAAVDRLKKLCDNPPKILGNPATWWIYSEEDEEYHDSGFPASGRSPYIDKETMHWMQWNDEKGEYEDTGISPVYPEYTDIDSGLFLKLLKGEEETDEDTEEDVSH